MNNLGSESVRFAMVYMTHEDVRKTDMYQVETFIMQSGNPHLYVPKSEN